MKTANIMAQDAAILCDHGLQAYMAQDYQTAIPYYQASVQLGSSAAMCNLGYCYYYGRGVKRDKELARYYWETSAVLGEAASTYKLGDMHRNGDIEANESVAWLYYCRAWQLSQNEKDILNYPNICLRLARYGAGRLTVGQRLSSPQKPCTGLRNASRWATSTPTRALPKPSGCTRNLPRQCCKIGEEIEHICGASKKTPTA